MSHYDCKECDSSPHEDHAPSCSKHPIPEWALKEAVERLDAECAAPRGVYKYPDSKGMHQVKVVARLIAKYEPAPVDPDVEALKRVLAAYGYAVTSYCQYWDRAFAQYKKEIAAAKERG